MPSVFNPYIKDMSEEAQKRLFENIYSTDKNAVPCKFCGKLILFAKNGKGKTVPACAVKEGDSYRIRTRDWAHTKEKCENYRVRMESEKLK